MSPLIPQNYTTEVKAALHCLIKLHLQAAYASLSLGFCFDHYRVAPEGVGHFLKLAEEKCKGTQSLLKVQNQRGGRIHFQDVLKPSQDTWGKTQGVMEAALVMERNLNQALGLCKPWFYPHRTSSL